MLEIEQFSPLVYLQWTDRKSETWKNSIVNNNTRVHSGCQWHSEWPMKQEFWTCWRCSRCLLFCSQLDDYEEMEKDMAAINSLLSQELQARCRYNKDGATMEFTATLPQGQDAKDSELVLQRKIERLFQTTQISDADLPGGSFVVLCPRLVCKDRAAERCVVDLFLFSDWWTCD